MDNKLLPCPFCGYPDLGVTHHTTSFDGIELWSVNCKQCNAKSGLYTESEAIKAWNKRFDVKCSHPDCNCAVKCNDKPKTQTNPPGTSARRDRDKLTMLLIVDN